jgi:hypothetical protein
VLRKLQKLRNIRELKVALYPMKDTRVSVAERSERRRERLQRNAQLTTRSPAQRAAEQSALSSDELRAAQSALQTLKRALDAVVPRSVHLMLRQGVS